MVNETPAGGLLSNRIAVVTGGAGGIGAATAQLFARQGAHVVIADVDTERAQQTADEITTSGGSAFAVVTDVRDADQVAALARSVLERHGRVDALVNNVGHWLRHPGNFVDTDSHLWDELYRINLHHVFLVTRAFLPALSRSRGAVVNVVSLAAVAAVPVTPAYSVSKAAALSLTQSLRALLAGQGVSVYAVMPGPIDTEMVRSLDVPKAPPEDVATAALSGVEQGEEEIFPDSMSASLEPGWNSGAVKAMERQNAGLVTLTSR